MLKLRQWPSWTHSQFWFWFCHYNSKVEVYGALKSIIHENQRINDNKYVTNNTNFLSVWVSSDRVSFLESISVSSILLKEISSALSLLFSPPENRVYTIKILHKRNLIYILTR